MRFVPVRSVENQAQLMRHRARELLVGHRTRMLNALRGHLGEIGVVASQGVQNAYALKRLLADGCDDSGEVIVPDCVRRALAPLVHQIEAIDAEIAAIDEEIKTLVKVDETARRLMTIPGVGPITAQAIVATVRSTSAFANGREFAASLGLTPRQNSTGGKERLGRITKMGDRYLRKLLVVGACATLCHRKGHNDALRVWAGRLLARKAVKYKFKLTAVALANKVARIVFALMTRGGEYNELPIAA
jgi:transposase